MISVGKCVFINSCWLINIKIVDVIGNVSL